MSNKEEEIELGELLEMLSQQRSSPQHPTNEQLLLETGIDVDQGSFTLTGEVCEEMYDYCFRALRFLRKSGATRVIIYLNSFGGAVYEGLAIYDIISQFTKELEIIIVGTGKVMSAATIIMQAATKRVVSKHTKLLTHYGYSGDEGEAVSFLRGADHYRTLLNDMMQILMDRTGKKMPTVRGWLEKDTYFNAEQALRANLIDEVVE